MTICQLSAILCSTRFSIDSFALLAFIQAALLLSSFQLEKGWNIFGRGIQVLGFVWASYRHYSNGSVVQLHGSRDRAGDPVRNQVLTPRLIRYERLTFH